jgi:FKBP-type peptidyl-prolyl cis-trans isomerase SlyD
MNIGKDSAVTLLLQLSDTDGEALTDEGYQMAYLHGGYGNLFPKLEALLEGKAEGATIEAALDPEDAFGDYDADLIRVEDRALFPETLELGMQFEGIPGDSDGEAEDADWEAMIYTVTDIADGKVVVDGNHPLAGERIWVRATVESVRAATEDEIQHGHVHGAHGVVHAQH